MNSPAKLAVITIIYIIISPQASLAQPDYKFGPFNSSYYTTFAVLTPATISNNALQITPDSAGNFTLSHRSGRVFFNHPFTLWEKKGGGFIKLASFNTSFRVNVFRINNSTTVGEGLAFVIAPDLNLPPNSDGQYLGLTNSTTDGNTDNGIVAVELDTFKQDFDPDDNHMGLDIHSIRSNKTVRLSDFGIEISPMETKIYMVWIKYDGVNKSLEVFMAEDGKPMPETALLSSDLDLSNHVKQNSYFGFAASTGSSVQLNCVLGWNLTVEKLSSAADDASGGGDTAVKVGVAAGVGGGILLVIAGGGVAYYLVTKRTGKSNPNILGALKSLPGTPREFAFKDLKKATNNFDEKNKLGQGGFGVVFKGVLPDENVPVAVKKFSRDNLKSQDDFLAELTIINRLRHKNLVRLLGWCHKNETLLLVYDYMPNGSLDGHIFPKPEDNKAVLEWKRRYNIIAGVASALHYLHNEYDQKVVHRDLKASNIMLDSNFNARLGDFGLARAIDNEKTSYAELEGIQGTLGYIAPECFHTGKATRESDVYGFGAVVLEVVCGQRPWTKHESFNLLVDWVWWLHREGRILEAVDERLGNDYVVEEAQRLLLLGLACSHPIAAHRPKTNIIFQIISGSVEVPRVPPFKPAFVWASGAAPELSSSSMTMDMSPDTTPITSGWGWSPQSQSISPHSYPGGYIDRLL
ncbi:Concanavalin A-like lectin protein kinase family protein [Euphorbia peplus]|nr:Concanavalin A-like lectin protein kinase family protein [Euphorbia peplus]